MANADEVGVDKIMAMVEEVVIVARAVASISRREVAAARELLLVSSMSLGVANDCVVVPLPLATKTLLARPDSGATKDAAGEAAPRRMRSTAFIVWMCCVLCSVCTVCSVRVRLRRVTGDGEPAQYTVYVRRAAATMTKMSPIHQ